jgi:predicted tellurium resistance membrane protein TerC
MESLIGFCGLTVLLIILSIDNAVFISILSGKLQPEEQEKARKIGFLLATVTNMVLVTIVGGLKGFGEPFLSLGMIDISLQDIILAVGGLVLIAKATSEIHDKLEGTQDREYYEEEPRMTTILFNIFVINLVFSVDTVLTAIGMAEETWIMVASIIIASLFLISSGEMIAKYVIAHPTLKVLALAFLILIGSNLIVEAFHVSIPKGYTYFAMAFALTVEVLNLRIKSKNRIPVALHQPFIVKPKEKEQN